MGSEAKRSRPQAAGLGRGHLDAEETFECGGGGEVFGGGLIEDPGQRLGGGVQLQRGQMAAQLLVEAGLARLSGSSRRWRW
ncbi:hypothetical protein [Saccharopolyspora spinosa]|uniref:hypothetical protein n=1 Tax=Saccharopolyspora spinosa TaxID=60894 RepID=UPI003749CFAE